MEEEEAEMGFRDARSTVALGPEGSGPSSCGYELD